jgi:hypothetical protein
MKFSSLNDKKLFLMEVERIDLIDSVDEAWVPPQELMELFIQRRGSLIKGLKDFRKSQNTKSQWRRDRYKIMRGINRFHRSTKGKQFHRSMGRFLATRLTGGADSVSSKGIIGATKENESILSLELFTSLSETLKALSSMRTHIYIEADAYMPVSEYVEFLEFTEHVLDASFSIERSLLRFDQNFKEEDLDIVARATNPSVLVDEAVKAKYNTSEFNEFATYQEKFLSLVKGENMSFVEILQAL